MRTPKSQKELDELLIASHKRESAAKIFDELRWALTVLNLLDVRSMIEIGAENGGSLSVWQKLWDPMAAFIVDADVYGLAASRENRVNRWNSWMSPTQSLDVTWGDSHSPDTKKRLIDSMAKRGLNQVDLLVVDGDHSEAGTEADYVDYSPLVRSGGLVLMEDINRYVKDDGTDREDVMGWKWWNRFKPPVISQLIDRAPHPRPNWHVWDLFHDKDRQRSFGYGFVFKY